MREGGSASGCACVQVRGVAVVLSLSHSAPVHSHPIQRPHRKGVALPSSALSWKSSCTAAPKANVLSSVATVRSADGSCLAVL